MASEAVQQSEARAKEKFGPTARVLERHRHARRWWMLKVLDVQVGNYIGLDFVNEVQPWYVRHALWLQIPVVAPDRAQVIREYLTRTGGLEAASLVVEG